MKKPQSEASSSPRVHSENIRRELSALIAHLEADSRRVTDERFRGLLGKSGEVLKGLRSLFERFDATIPATPEKSAEPASRKGGAERRSEAAAKPKTAGKFKEETKNSSRSQGSAQKKSAASSIGASSAEPAEADDKQNQLASSDVASTPAKNLSGNSKPQDPDEIAAQAQLQRKEARAPQKPRGSAPKPMPPQSGKPIWSKPHSA